MPPFVFHPVYVLQAVRVSLSYYPTGRLYDHYTCSIEGQFRVVETDTCTSLYSHESQISTPLYYHLSRSS